MLGAWIISFHSKTGTYLCLELRPLHPRRRWRQTPQSRSERALLSPQRRGDPKPLQSSPGLAQEKQSAGKGAPAGRLDSARCLSLTGPGTGTANPTPDPIPYPHLFPTSPRGAPSATLPTAGSGRREQGAPGGQSPRGRTANPAHPSFPVPDLTAPLQGTGQPMHAPCPTPQDKAARRPGKLSRRCGTPGGDWARAGRREDPAPGLPPTPPLRFRCDGSRSRLRSASFLDPQEVLASDRDLSLVSPGLDNEGPGSLRSTCGPRELSRRGSRR